jgi:tryptophan-rich sensory protein
MNKTQALYQTMIKPGWAPPAWIFGPVWTILYLIIAVTFGAVFYKAFRGKVPLTVALIFVLNLFFNFAFMPLQFGLHNFTLASLDILLVLGTLVWALIAIFKDMPWVSYANIPYLLWVTFATILQLTITFLNWK